MRLRSGWWLTCSGAVRFLRACPLLALLPAAAELAQHAAEMHLGFYDGMAGARTTAADPLRLGPGLAKALALILPGYWVTRFLAWGDSRLAMRAEPVAVRRFAGYAAAQAGLTVAGVAAGLGPGWLVLAWSVPGLLIGALLPAWGVAAPLGNEAIGPVDSVRLMRGQMGWTIGLSLLAVLPLMVPHYALSYAAMLGPRRLRWPLLLADSLLVSGIGAVMVSAGFVAAERAARCAGVALVPADGLSSRRA